MKTPPASPPKTSAHPLRVNFDMQLDVIIDHMSWKMRQRMSGNCFSIPFKMRATY